MADADADAAEIIADMRVGGTKAVVPRRTAAGFHLDPEWGEIELVVKDGDVLRLHLEKAHRLADRSTAFIHVSRGFQQQDLDRSQPPFACPPMKTAAPWIATVHLRTGV